jgi:hypothetical protein
VPDILKIFWHFLFPKKQAFFYITMKGKNNTMNEKTKEFRKNIAEAFIKSLEEKQLDWKNENLKVNAKDVHEDYKKHEPSIAQKAENKLTVLFKDDTSGLEAGINADGNLYFGDNKSGYNLDDTIDNRHRIARDIERYTGQKISLVSTPKESIGVNYKYFYSGEQDKEADAYQQETGWHKIWASDSQGMNGDTWIVYRNADDLPKFLQNYARDQESYDIRKSLKDIQNKIDEYKKVYSNNKTEEHYKTDKAIQR